MRNKLYLLPALVMAWATGAPAQAPNILQGPYLGADTVSRSSASVAWTTDIPATTKIKWGTVATSLKYTSAPASGDVPVLVHGWYLFGTPGNSTIYFQACSTANSVETCSPVNSYTSGTQDAVPADPIPPAPVDPPVVPAGAIHTVGADCDDPASGLVAQWTAANRGDIVEIDPSITPYCAGSYIFPPKPSGPPYILTRVKNADWTFPNYRRANLADLPTQTGFSAHTNAMARFIHNGPNIDMEGGADPSNALCFGGTLRWRQYQNNAWAMYRCNNTGARPLASIPSVGVAGHRWAAGADLTSLVIHSGVATVNVSSTYGIQAGMTLVIAGSTTALLNGSWLLQTVASGTLTFYSSVNGIPIPDGTYNNAGLVAWYSLANLSIPNHGIPGGLWQGSAGNGQLLSIVIASNGMGTANFSAAPHVVVGQSVIFSGVGSNADGETAISGISGNSFTFSTGGLPGTYSGPDIQVQTQSMGWITGVTGPGAGSINGGWKLIVLDANTIQIHPYIDSGPVTVSGAASGGTLSLNVFQIEPVTEGSSLPPTCNFGDWWHKNAASGTEDEYHRTWYCDAPNEWIPLRLDVNSASTPFPVIDIATNKLDHLMFQGLSFEPMHQKADPQRLQYQYNVTLYNTGATYWTFLGQSIYNDHIYWDNLLAGCPDPSLTGEMERCDSLAIDFSGSQIHLGGSYLYGFQLFHSLQDLSDASATVIVPFQGGPMEITNNFIECAGICVYASDDIAATTEAHDWTLTRNTVVTPDRYWDPNGALLRQGFYFSQRHRSERKRIHRELDNGNIFTGGWVWNNNAAGICLCTRSSTSAVQVQSISDTAIQGYEPTAVSHGWIFNDVKVGDLMAFTALPYGATGACASLLGKIFTVTSVTGYSHISINSTGCTAAGGAFLTRLNAPSANISDVLITNQTWLHNPTDFEWLGHDSYATNAAPILQRVKLFNNLSLGTDGTRIGQGPYYGVPFGPSGNHIALLEGGEDLQISHDTVIGRVKGSFMAMDYGNGGASAASGLTLNNSIFEYLNRGDGIAFSDGISYGKAFLDREWSDAGPTPSYSLAQDMILRRGGCGSGFYDPCAGFPFGPYPLGVLWFDSAAAQFPFFNPAGDYRIKTSSSYVSGGVNHATDGLDIGVNIDVLEAAQGKVSNVRVFGLQSGSATVGFLAPDNLGCPVDWSVDNFATYTRAPNTGGARVQNVSLSGLPASADISYRVQCAVMQPSGKFHSR